MKATFTGTNKIEYRHEYLTFSICKSDIELPKINNIGWNTYVFSQDVNIKFKNIITTVVDKCDLPCGRKEECCLKIITPSGKEVVGYYTRYCKEDGSITSESFYL